MMNRDYEKNVDQMKRQDDEIENERRERQNAQEAKEKRKGQTEKLVPEEKVELIDGIDIPKGLLRLGVGSALYSIVGAFSLFIPVVGIPIALGAFLFGIAATGELEKSMTKTTMVEPPKK